MTPARASLLAKGLLDAEGRITPAGDAWIDEQIAKLRTKTKSIGEKND